MAKQIKKAGREGINELDIDLGKGLILKCKLEIVPACPIRDSMLFATEKGSDNEEETKEGNFQEIPS